MFFESCVQKVEQAVSELARSHARPYTPSPVVYARRKRTQTISSGTRSSSGEKSTKLRQNTSAVAKRRALCDQVRKKRLAARGARSEDLVGECRAKGHQLGRPPRHRLVLAVALRLHHAATKPCKGHATMASAAMQGDGLCFLLPRCAITPPLLCSPTPPSSPLPLPACMVPFQPAILPSSPPPPNTPCPR